MIASNEYEQYDYVIKGIRNNSSSTCHPDYAKLTI